MRASLHLFIPIIALLLSSSCQSQETARPYDGLYGPFNEKNPDHEPGLEIRAWTNDIHQDRKGTMWFGTKGWGLIRYDGDTVVYLSTKEGLAGNDVREMAEDKDGTLWLGTEGGLTKWQNGTMTNYSLRDGLVNNDVHSLAIDSEGLLWIGTSNGLSTYNGQEFSTFDLPETESDSVNFVRSKNMVHSIMEDSMGNIWFGTNGGAYTFDGDTLKNISEKDGLCDNTVKSILEDSSGNYWFSTQNGGVCRRDGSRFTKLETEPHPYGSMATADLYQDSEGNIWLPVEDVAMYRYDGNRLEKMFQPQGCISHTLRCTYEDSRGRIWFGGWNGIYRYDG